MSRVRKAVITAAGRGTRHFPVTQLMQKEMIPLVDRDGTTKPTIQIILEEALEAGIEEFCLVISPRTEDQFRAHFHGLPLEQAAAVRSSWVQEENERLRDLGRRIRYVVQEQQEGYGHAVYCARDFVGDEPFLLLLGDHILISSTKAPCSRQVIQVYQEHNAPVTGVQRTGSDMLHLFGTLAGRRILGEGLTYEVTAICEKPTVEFAEEHLRVAGLARDEYLCFFGAHAFPPTLFDAIEYHIRNNIREQGEIQLTNSLELLRGEGRYLATEIDGDRYDMGVPMGYLQTQLALALNSPARRQLLSALPHLVAQAAPDEAR